MGYVLRKTAIFSCTVIAEIDTAVAAGDTLMNSNDRPLV